MAARFWSKVDKNGPVHPVLGTRCWLWTASKNPVSGYGQFTWAERYGRERPVTAHRVAWELTHGPIPEGQSVLHHCDRQICVNAEEHHFLGTQLDNMRDAAAKGHFHVPRPNKQTVSDADVAAILERRTAGQTLLEIARAFGVSKTYVSLLASGKRRQHKPLKEHAS